MEAFINLDRGDAGAAIKTTREIVDIADRIGLLPVQTGSRADLGLLYAQLGQIDRGRALALQAYHYAEQMAPLRAWTQAALARIELCAGRLPEAAQYSELAYPGYALLLKGLSVLVPAWAEIALARAEVQLERGRYVEAIATMDELAGALNAHGVRPFVCEAHYLKGRAQLALERWTEAAQSLAAAHADAEALGSRKVLWRTLMAERRLVLRRDDSAGAEKLREAAREIILALAACVPEDALRASFLALPDVRDTAPAETK